MAVKRSNIAYWVLMAVFLLAGLAVLAYPAISSYLNARNSSYAIVRLAQQLDMQEDAWFSQQLQLAQGYNTSLKALGTAAGYEDILNVDDGIMGYLEIPKLDLQLPIYHGVSDSVLAKGAGHLPETAFPIGGSGNHSVLTGHTGLPSAKLFTQLTELEEGDIFYIHILKDTLLYQIDQILTVLPDETQALAAKAGQDYCTLVTCTPYGINSHRLLVRGSRIISEQPVEVTGEAAPTRQWMWWLAGGIILGIAAFWLVCSRKRRKP